MVKIQLDPSQLNVIDAISDGDIEYVKIHINRHSNTSIEYVEKLFILAAKSGFLNIIKYLMSEFNFNVNAQDDLAFQYASCYGRFDCVKFLVEECGANIHACDDYAFKFSNIYNHYNVNNYLKLVFNSRQKVKIYNDIYPECCVCLLEKTEWIIMACKSHRVCNTCSSHLTRCPLCREE